MLISLKQKNSKKSRGLRKWMTFKEMCERFGESVATDIRDAKLEDAELRQKEVRDHPECKHRKDMQQFLCLAEDVEENEDLEEVEKLFQAEEGSSDSSDDSTEDDEAETSSSKKAKTNKKKKKKAKKAKTKKASVKAKPKKKAVPKGQTAGKDSMTSKPLTLNPKPWYIIIYILYTPPLQDASADAEAIMKDAKKARAWV
ncbi:unnamed protein product [Symbiodinium necroappetens]|uniref:Uncharacterized protein n=1 Tax=Symbiodinium necroappetens TaxID=1628268 RepID=A0A812IP97_9DINO|nr:unnamed protein product [Symbiodinium necroappetens]